MIKDSTKKKGSVYYDESENIEHENKNSSKNFKSPKLKNILLATTIATGTMLGIAKYDNYKYEKNPIFYNIEHVYNEYFNFFNIDKTPNPIEKATASFKLFANKLGKMLTISAMLLFYKC